MNILISGGTGLIGSAFIAKFQDKYEFTVISRKASRLKKNISENVRYISPEVLDTFTDLNDFDAVINLAGEGIADSKWSKERKQKLCHSRWKITNQLVALTNASEKPPAVFISGSAIGVYGRQSAEPIDEYFTAYHEEFSHIICQRWEQIALEAKTRTCLLRTGIVLSASGGALKKMWLPFKLGLGGPIGDGEQFMSWIHIDDQISAIDFLLNNDTCRGAYNLTAPKPVSNFDFSKALANAMHRPMFLITPVFVLKTLLGELSEILIYGQNVVPTRLQDAGFKFKYSDIAEALKHCV